MQRDLLEIVKTAQEMAAKGQGLRTKYLGMIPRDEEARRQFSFSRLTGKLHARPAGGDGSPLDGDVSASQPLDAREFGTLVHSVLAELDFARPETLSDLASRLAEEQFIAPGETLTELTAMIERFLASPRAAALASATQVHRELEFLLAWPPEEDAVDAPQTSQTEENTLDASNAVDGSQSSPAAIRYLQGFIDCLYCDAEGRWRLIDYKTNRVTADRLAATAADYEMQMLVYALAVERILRQPPAELVLYFLRPCLEYHFTWDDAARQRAIEIVNRALP